MNKKIILTAVALVILMTGACFAEKADLPQQIREQLHDDISYTVINDYNLKNLDSIVEKGPEKHFFVLQVMPENLKPEHAEKLIGWVKNGGILWFYDSRLAGHFGMKHSPMKAGEFEGKDHTGSYGVHKVKGMNVIAHAYPFSEHPTARGVQSIQVFMMETGEGEYSAVAEKTPGVIPIFRINLEEKAVVAAKKFGEGQVIFKPLLWPDVLGGERFQVNLMEFSGGYPVPRETGSILPSGAYDGKAVDLDRYDSVMLSNGEHVIGMLREKNIEVVGDEGILALSIDKIDSIKFQSTGTKVKLTDGREITGTVMSMDFKFETTTGKRVDLDKSDLMSIDFNVGK